MKKRVSDKIPFEKKNLVKLAPAAVVIAAVAAAGAQAGNSGKEVLKLFQCLSDMGNTIVMITHDLSVAEHAKRVVRIVDGELYEN